MKRYIYFIIPFLLLPFVSSCENDTDGPSVTEIIPSVVTDIPEGIFNLSEFDEEDENPLLFTLRWTPLEFRAKGNNEPQRIAPINYSVQIDKAGNNFADAATLAATTADTVDVFRKDLNDVLLSQLNLEAFETYQLELRISVKIGEGSHEFNQMYSENKVTFTAIPNEGLQPVYMIGTMNNWDTSNTDFMLFRDNSNEKEFEYTYVGRIAANTSFKFISKSNLGTQNMFYDAGNGTLELGENADGAFYNAEEGYYEITLDIKKLTVEIKPYDMTGTKEWPVINFVGAFCDWGAAEEGEDPYDPEMIRSDYDPHIWTLEIKLETIQYGVKFRANHSWENKWCPQDTKAVPFGVCNYNPENDPNISLDETGTGTYFIRFNDLTGHYIITKQ